MCGNILISNLVICRSITVYIFVGTWQHDTTYEMLSVAPMHYKYIIYRDHASLPHLNFVGRNIHVPIELANSFGARHYTPETGTSCEICKNWSNM